MRTKPPHHYFSSSPNLQPRRSYILAHITYQALLQLLGHSDYLRHQPQFLQSYTKHSSNAYQLTTYDSRLTIDHARIESRRGGELFAVRPQHGQYIHPIHILAFIDDEKTIKKLATVGYFNDKQRAFLERYSFKFDDALKAVDIGMDAVNNVNDNASTFNYLPSLLPSRIIKQESPSPLTSTTLNELQKYVGSFIHFW